MAKRNNFIVGVTEILILKLLAEKDSYVYDICNTIEKRSNGILKLSQNTVYNATYKLENEKMITQHSELVGRKKTRIYYHLEEKGLDYLKQSEKEYFYITDGIFALYKNSPDKEKRGTE